MSEITLFIKNKEVKGFIIEEVNGYYKIGTYLGIIYKKKSEINHEKNRKMSEL